MPPSGCSCFLLYEMIDIRLKVIIVTITALDSVEFPG